MAIGTAEQMFVGGQRRPSASGEAFRATSPSTGDWIGTIPTATAMTPDRRPL